MDQAEFDKFAEEYRSTHVSNIKSSGETPEFFAEYKIKDVADYAKKYALPDKIKVLDFGAGVGTSLPYFEKYFPHAHITCIDVSQKSLDIGRGRFTGAVNFVHFDGKCIPLDDDSFNIVFAACVFHHIPHAEHAHLLSEILRVLKPLGVLFVFEHNPYNPLTVRAVNTCPFDENAVLIKSTDMVQRVRSAGMGDIVRKYRIFIPGALRQLRGLERYITWLPLGAQYYIAARKTGVV